MSRSPYTTCKSCGTPVVWIATRSDKRMPVHREDRNGQRVSSTEIFDKAIHISHFAECPNADKHRRPRGGTAPAPAPPVPDERRANWPGDFRRPPAPAPSPVAAERLPIFGLTLPQPWPWAVAWAGLPYLLQDWEPHRAPPFWLALHAGTEYDLAAAEVLQRRFPDRVVPGPGEVHRQSVVAVARYAGIAHYDDPLFAAAGPTWLLEAVTPILPVPCPGGARLWILPGEVLSLVRGGWTAARRQPLVEVPPVILTAQEGYPWGNT